MGKKTPARANFSKEQQLFADRAHRPTVTETDRLSAEKGRHWSHSKTLAQMNPLKGEEAVRRRIRSIAGSTAIETGQSIEEIEEQIMFLRASREKDLPD